MRLTVPHYFDFQDDRRLVGDDLVRPEAWDAIRTQSTGPFALPSSRADWESLVRSQTDYGERAKSIDAVLRDRVDGSVASYGVGTAALEYWLHAIRPERRLLVGEYAPETTERLRDLFEEAEVHQHDLLTDAPLPADWHVFHRIDTEFTNSQWRQVLERFSSVSVVFVASEIVRVRDAASEVMRGWRNRNATRSGYLRNRAAFESLWRDSHRAEPVPAGDLDAWVLTPRPG